MDFSSSENSAFLRQLWFSTEILRDVEYTLFTFGESELPYYLIEDAETLGEPITVYQGQVNVSRPRIINPYSEQAEIHGFFDDPEQEQWFSVLLSRTAAFSRMSFSNTHGLGQRESDSVEEVASRLNRRLDEEEEDRVAILSAPHGLGGVAVLRYTVERVLRSAPDNIKELRDRGFLD